MICVVTDYVEPDLDWEARRYREENIEFRPYQLRGASTEAILDAVRDAHVVVVDQLRITAEILRGMRNCRLIIRHGDGTDNLDLATARELGIPCASKPGFWSREVAEQALMLILALRGRLPAQQDIARHPDFGAVFPWDLPRAFPAHRLEGSQAGVIGFGRIGRLAAAKLMALGVETMVYDTYVDDNEIRDAGAMPVSFEQLIETSEIITIHVPKTPETTGLFHQAVFRRMKPGVILVNTSRGGILDTQSLLEALEDGTVGAAGLDSTDPEPLPPEHPLLHRENVIVTPHLGWYSEEAMWAMRRSIVDDVIRFRDGLLPSSIVTT